MARKKARRAKSQKSVQRATRIQPQKSKLALTLGAVVGAMTLFGCVATLLELFPRVTVSNREPIDLNDPFSTPFRIVNEGYLPLFSVKFFMTDVEVDGTKIIGICSAPSWQLARFDPLDSFDLYPAEVIHSQFLRFASLAVVIQYRPLPWIFRERVRVSRFATQPGSGNRLYWIKKP
jgi:hypothetical protein